MPGPMSFIIIGVVALLVFGPKKLPELGKAFAKPNVSPLAFGLPSF